MNAFCFLRNVALLGLVALVPGCGVLEGMANRFNDIGTGPKLATVQDPSPIAGPTPVRMPMPPPSVGSAQPNSLWQTGSRAFFRDQRAGRVGDILTVVIQIDEKAQLANETKRSRDNTEAAGITNLLGFENKIKDYFPNTVDPTSLVKTGSTLSNDGKGSIDRSEKINLRVAATITQVLPNGNFVVAGRQQVAVNQDMRELQVTGVVRPEDIASDNTVNYDQIAEARIAYGGRGTLNDVQQPRYGTQILDIVMPF